MHGYELRKKVFWFKFNEMLRTLFKSHNIENFRSTFGIANTLLTSRDSKWISWDITFIINYNNTSCTSSSLDKLWKCLRPVLIAYHWVWPINCIYMGTDEKKRFSDIVSIHFTNYISRLDFSHKKVFIR